MKASSDSRLVPSLRPPDSYSSSRADENSNFEEKNCRNMKEGRMEEVGKASSFARRLQKRIFFNFFIKKAIHNFIKNKKSSNEREEKDQPIGWGEESFKKSPLFF